MAAIATAARANSVVGGIRNDMVGGGVVSATAKSAMADRGIANLRSNTNAISYLLDNPRRKPTGAPYCECDARCSASHCSLIQPSLAEFTPPGTRTLGMVTTADQRDDVATMNSMWFSPHSAPRNDRDTQQGDCLCAYAHGMSRRLQTLKHRDDRPCWPATLDVQS
jgi:hypothetical protein